MERILSLLFPPRLPRIEEFQEQASADPFASDVNESGLVGRAQPKKYRDGIERHFAENI